MFSVPLEQLRAATLTVRSDSAATTAELTGTDTEPLFLAGDFRPQVVGVFSDLTTSAGASVEAEVDSRFSVTPTFTKRAATVLAVVLTAVALIALLRLDRSDGRRIRRLVPQRWRTVTGIDAGVLATLLLWHFIGSTTSDDGYQFGMARTSLVSGYMANYFRFFGVPENPVGTPPYDVIAQLTEISIASPWVRLPTLLAGVLAWLTLSREVIPRLGAGLRRDRIVVGTGALGFLAIWLPYNNGLRPEPVIAVAVLLTWVFVEHAIASRRLLPYAIAILIAAFSLTAAPSGVICFAPLAAGARSVVRFGLRRARAVAAATARRGADSGRPARISAYGALLAPLAAAGTLVLVFAFGVQPLSAMFEMTRVHNAVGPSVPWFDDYQAYQRLFTATADGSIGRRFGVVAMWLGLLVCAFVLLRKGGRIPFVTSGPAKRLLGITFGAMLLMATVPTKFTHHNGVFAGPEVTRAVRRHRGGGAGADLHRREQMVLRVRPRYSVVGYGSGDRRRRDERDIPDRGRAVPGTRRVVASAGSGTGHPAPGFAAGLAVGENSAADGGGGRDRDLPGGLVRHRRGHPVSGVLPRPLECRCRTGETVRTGQRCPGRIRPEHLDAPAADR
jgi:arabinosyltransferase C